MISLDIQVKLLSIKQFMVNVFHAHIAQMETYLFGQEKSWPLLKVSIENTLS